MMPARTVSVSHPTRPVVRLLRSVLLATVFLGAACRDGTIPEITGTLGLSVTTTGVDPDSDGYRVLLDSGQTYVIPPNGTLVLDSLYTGDHLLTLLDIAGNCRAANNPRTITVPPGRTLAVSVAVTCVASTGSVALWLQTSGEDVDTNGYTLTVDGVPALQVPITGPVSVGPLPVGSHTLALTDVSANCEPSAPSLTVQLSQGTTVQVTYAVRCTSLTGRLLVSAATGGADLDADGYALTIDGVTAGSVPINGALTVSGIDPGTRVVALTDVAWNCASGSLADTVAVTAGQATAVAFTVSCAAGPRLRVTTSATGVDLDPNGYALSVAEAFAGVRVPVNGDSLVGPVPPGVHAVELGDVASNCQVTGGTSRSLSFALAETVSVRFDVACARAQVIAFTRLDALGLAVVHADGYELHSLTSGYDRAPAWSPDGTRVAYLRWVCDIFEESCSYTEVVVVKADGTGAQVILQESYGTSPTWLAWKPDGSRIAFSGWYDGTAGLFQMDPDGSNVTPILEGTGLGHPSWAPDGTRLVVECTVEPGNTDLCLVNGDGSGFQRLTTAPDSEYTPAWSPDGSRILFASTGATRGLKVVNPDGSGMALLVSGWVAWPTWSADGEHIAFVDSGSCFDPDCWFPGVLVATADGHVTGIVSPAGTEPAWRP